MAYRHVVRINPLEWVEGANRDRAAGAVVRYLESDPGQYFDVFAAEGAPNRFGWSDLAAVASLSVTVPAEVADWLIIGDGADETSRLLAGIGDGSTTWSSASPAPIRSMATR